MDTAQTVEFFQNLERGVPALTRPKVPMDLVEYTITEKQEVNDKLVLLTVARKDAKKEGEMKEDTYMGGQFLELWVPGYGEKPFAPSIARGDELTMAIGDVGTLTHYLVSDAAVGSSIFVRGPYGKGFTFLKETEAFRQTVPPIKGHAALEATAEPVGSSDSSVLSAMGELEISEASRNFVLVGGGTGIAPLLLLAQQLSEQGRVPRENIHVYLGGRTSVHVYHVRDFRRYSASVNVATNDGSSAGLDSAVPTFQGFVTQMLQRDLAGGAVNAGGKDFVDYKVGVQLFVPSKSELGRQLIGSGVCIAIGRMENEQFQSSGGSRRIPPAVEQLNRQIIIYS